MFEYDIPSNSTPSAREAAFLILDGASNVAATHRVTQERPVSCSYVTNPRETRVPKTGGTGSFTVVTEPADCRWTLENTFFSGFTISPRSGQGTTRITFTSPALNFDTYAEIGIWGLSRQNPPGKHRVIWGTPSNLPPFSR
ncbi:MAG TPA: hypothetical protein VHJ77_09090 [Vicinamibacterales bacterium]|nr:hypothetical protein [Vicinamibacterales bacterium]